MTKNLKEEMRELLLRASKMHATQSVKLLEVAQRTIELFMQRAREKTVWDGESEHRVILLFDLEAIAKELD